MAERPSAGDYIQVLKTTVPNMVDQIGELAKAELKPAAKHGGIGAGAFGGAAVVGGAVVGGYLLFKPKEEPGQVPVGKLGTVVLPSGVRF